jgi:hypothetical protein
MSIFLTPDEVAELTGIKRGRDKLTRNDLQVMQLRAMHIAFFINASGRPIVTKAAVEGTIEPRIQKQAWRPAVLSH